MASDQSSLKWSAQYSVAPVGSTTRLQGDKITLPPSALEALLSAAPIVNIENGRTAPYTSTFDPYNPHTFAAERELRQQFAERQQQLPHPLTFRLVNPSNGRVVYAGIREFSAEEETVGLSQFLRESLGLVSHGESEPTRISNGDVSMADTVEDEGNDKSATITVHFKELPKGSYVRLRPLEAGYDPEDWKSLLERYLRDNFTTMTNGEILDIKGGWKEHFRFLVDKFLPEGDGICIVDTDLEVDIEALNEDQARETLRRKLEKDEKAPGTKEGSSKGGRLNVGDEYDGQVIQGEYVDFEVHDYGTNGLIVELEVSEEAELDLFLSPFSARQRARPREDEHILGDFEARPTKRLRLEPTNVELEGAEAIYVSVHAYEPEASDEPVSKEPRTFVLRTSSAIQMQADPPVTDHDLSSDEVQFPQQGPDDPSLTDPEVMLSGLTPHELSDGSRTTECHLCSRIVRLRDMKTHLKHHDLDRLTRPTPHLCSNTLCAHTIPAKDLDNVLKTQLGLCNTCFGPLYAGTYDPELKALRRRVERRLLQQLMAGCGKIWCSNINFCRTGRKNQTGEDRTMGAKDALTIVKPIMDRLNSNTFSSSSPSTFLAFCTDESNQKRRLVADLVASESIYDLEWCVKAVEEVGSSGSGGGGGSGSGGNTGGVVDIEKVKGWLADWAPRRDEVRGKLQ